MADFSLMDLFGNTDSGLGQYLTEEQKRQIQGQANMSAAAALLKAGAPRSTPGGFGSALAEGLMAGQQGYQRAQEGAIGQLMTAQKLDEYKRQIGLQKSIQEILSGGGQAPTAGTAITPEQAISMPGLPAGPTVQRAEMIGQIQQGPQLSQNEMKANKYRQIADVLGVAGKSEEANRYFNMAEKLAPSVQKTVGDIIRGADGNFYQRTESGNFITVPSQFAPADKPLGTPTMMTDAYGKPVQVQRYESGALKAITEFGVPRDILLERLGDRVIAVDKSKITPGQEYSIGMAPTVVGGDATGYYLIGGAGVPAAAAAQPSLANIPTGQAQPGGGPLPSGMGLPQGIPTTALTPQVGTAQPPKTLVPSAAQVPAPGTTAAPQLAPGITQLIPGQGKGFANEAELRKEFTAQAKPFIEIGQAYQKIESAALNPSPAGDISLIFGFMKILDPGSVVREGEFATAANAGGINDRIRTMYNKALTGERLDEKIRADFLAQSRNLIESQRTVSQDLIDRFSTTASQYNLDPSRVTFDPFKRVKTPQNLINQSINPSGLPTPNYLSPQLMGGQAPNKPKDWWEKFNLIGR